MGRSLDTHALVHPENASHIGDKYQLSKVIRVTMVKTFRFM